MNMNNLILLFDLDGTLINTDKIYCDIWNDYQKIILQKI